MLLVLVFVGLLALFTHISAIVIPPNQRILKSVTSDISRTNGIGTKQSKNAEAGIPKISANFGIGIQLTAGYATVSVAYDDGTLMDIAKVEARPEYKAMMKRLSLESSRHPTPPYTEMSDAILDRQRQTDRSIRKSQGLPASDDVFTYAELLRSAREEAELYLWKPIEVVTVSTLNLVAVYAEDVNDALDFIGLNATKGGLQALPLLRSSTSSIISNGLGLNQNMTDLVNSVKSYADYPERNAISIEYTRDIFIAEAMVLKPALGFWPSTTSRPIARFDLGHDALRADPSGAFYWAAISEALSKVILQQLVARRPPSQIFLSGESVFDSTFRTVIKQVAKTLIGDIPEIRDETPLHAGSRGAAFLALHGGIDAFPLRTEQGHEKPSQD